MIDLITKTLVAIADAGSLRGAAGAFAPTRSDPQQ